MQAQSRCTTGISNTGFVLGLLMWLLSTSASAQYGANLIVNPGAEAAAGSTGEVISVPGWGSSSTSTFTAIRYGSSGFPSSADPGPADRGANFFAAGTSAETSAHQDIDLSSIAADVDTGSVHFTLSGYFGGWTEQNDNTSLFATFLSGGGQSLGSASIGPVLASARGNTTGFLSQTAVGTLPPGTRSVRVELRMVRTDGSYNDGYADNLLLVLSR